MLFEILSITGSRSLTDYEFFKDKLNELLETIRVKATRINSGGAAGIDSLAEEYAKEYYIPFVVYKPDWNKYGRSAGIKRSVDIINNSTLNIIFWDEISKGTKFNFEYCVKNNKKYFLLIKNGQIKSMMW